MFMLVIILFFSVVEKFICLFLIMKLGKGKSRAYLENVDGIHDAKRFAMQNVPASKTPKAR